MADSTYKVVELVGTSSDGIEDAITGALARASQTIHNLDWFQVKEIRGTIGQNGAVNWFQVTLGIGFKVLDAAELGGD